MYYVTVRQHFDAAHSLRGYRGKCENLHGHRFEVVASLGVEKLNEIGLAYDFRELKQHLRELLEKWDHAYLNDTPPFDTLNPSSENIAVAIYQELHSQLIHTPVSIYSVQVWESPDSGVTYSPGAAAPAATS